MISFPEMLISGTLPALFANRTVLLVGDSLDRNAVSFTCAAFRERQSKWLDVDLRGMGMSNYSYCHIRTQSADPVVLAQFMNYGSLRDPIGPDAPLWDYAYREQNFSKGVPTGLASTPDEHISRDATRIRAVLRGAHTQPDLVVIQSYLWDLARHWRVAGRRSRSFMPDLKTFLPHWVEGVRHQLAVARAAWPDALLAWRTAPPAAGLGRSASPSILKAMNDEVRALLAGQNATGHRRVRLLDWADFVVGRHNGSVAAALATTLDRMHPGEHDSLALVQMVFELLCRDLSSRPVWLHACLAEVIGSANASDASV